MDNQYPSQCLSLLQKMDGNWSVRAQVKYHEELNSQYQFDETQKDFRDDLLPFKDHPYYLQASEKVKNKILSCGWLIYNRKTVDIELKLINPVCNHIISERIPGTEDETIQQIASDTLVDESYHVKLVNKACSITQKHRGLQSLKLPEFHIVSEMSRALECCTETWQKIIVQLVTAIVSELLISDYLKLLADDMTIQPINRITVDTHRRDELAHSSIFKNLTKCIYSQLNEEEKKFFDDMLPKPVCWFGNMELDVWEAILKQIGFPQAEKMIAECKLNPINLKQIDYTGVTALAEELGILECDRGFDSFARQGLLN